MNLLERIMAKVVIDESGCWIYTGYLQEGYGRARLPVESPGVPGRKVLVHRYVYEALVADIADGLVLDHVCREKACCNPAHLEEVTPQENHRRGRWGILNTHCPNGHEWSDETTKWASRDDRPSAQRHCRICMSEYWKRRYRAIRSDPEVYERIKKRKNELRRLNRRNAA